jgi:hypothetical protein
MNYENYTLDELEEMLDKVVDGFVDGDIHHSSYTIEFNELYDAIQRKKQQPQGECPEKAYKRAMVGI